MSAPAVDSTATSVPATISADLSTTSNTTATSSSNPSSPSATSLTTSSLPSDTPSTASISSSLIDDSDDYDTLASDDTTNVALRKTKRKSSLTHTTTTSTPTTTTATGPSILHSFSLRGKAVQSTLSKGLSVALQYTKEKIGQASDVTQEEDSFTQHIDYARAVAAHLKSLTITLQSLIASQQTAILAHDAFAATVKKVANRGVVPTLTTPRSGARVDSGSGGLAAIEEMTSAFTEGASSPAAAPAKAEEGTEDEKTVEGKVDNENKASLSLSTSSDPTVQPSTAATTSTTPTINLIPSFYPYTRRHLSGRLIVSDSYASLLNSIQTLQAASVKAALAAISQLEIDRLHYDACQNNLRILTTTTNASSTPTGAASTPHPSDPTLSDDRRRLEYEQWTLKVDAAHLTYLRSKGSVEERVEELRGKVRDVLEKGLSVIVAIERYEVEAARALLSDEKAGTELSVRKKTNPAAMGIRRSGGRDDGEDEEGEDVASST